MLQAGTRRRTHLAYPGLRLLFLLNFRLGHLLGLFTFLDLGSLCSARLHSTFFSTANRRFASLLPSLAARVYAVLLIQITACFRGGLLLLRLLGIRPLLARRGGVLFPLLV